MPALPTTTVPIPTRTLNPVPLPSPGRRLHPDELCPAQKQRVYTTIKRSI